MKRKIKTLFVGLVSLMALPAMADDFEKATQLFQETATKHYSHQITLTEDESRRLCAEVGRKAVIHLKCGSQELRLHDAPPSGERFI